MNSRETIARIVADHWRRVAVTWDMPIPGTVAAHPLCCVVAALDGETDPAHLGIEPSSRDAERIRELGPRP
jgi:hypothetical protein